MSAPRRNAPHHEAAFLRAEGRFAAMVGVLAMGIGLALAFALSAAALADLTPAWAAAVWAAGPVIFGWAALCYASWRFEQAGAVLRGRRPSRLHLRASAHAALFAVRRRLERLWDAYRGAP